MKRNSSKIDQRPFQMPWWAIGSTMFIGLLLGICCQYAPRTAAPIVIVVFVLGIAMLSNFYLAFCIEKELGRRQRIRFTTRQLRKNRRRRRAVTSLQDQLNKPDFQSRLQAFVKADSLPEIDDGSPESTMEFWERKADYVRTPNRPIELLRFLLQRISKLVGQSPR